MASTKGMGADSRIEHGGNIAGSELPAFTLELPSHQRLPVLISAPHGGRDYPESLLAAMRKPEYATIRLEDRHVDSLAAGIARQTGAGLLIAHAPRAMLDLNRAQDDVDWDMIRGGTPLMPRHSHANRRARSGLGLVPRRLPGYGEIWKAHMTRQELDKRVEQIHRPYHAALGRVLEGVRDIWGAALLLDLHSMPPLKRRNEHGVPVQFVIGDRFGASCHGSIAERAVAFLQAEGQGVSHNRPYSGGFVLDRHALPSRGLHAVQLEVCRSAYLDAQLAEPGDSFESLVELLVRLVRHLGDATARLGEAGLIAQAAE
ncbi:N-formylglutamate amidohydrolase [Altererythrobacter arenosus]|uniref:N-formylglutamate amidohydrolase n=1 Tax=Altererythrobacter arenosus TaxID=3032592 RepID=A0ABY8FTJ4_9SPHN|nr:N-formylglutamate amidohydrolase [Altererythrobacter sp. CAU 1644]WFL76741.1 N-formylglutamate amidohydrolase [Altererythrobacter sp. CAU 1644]